MATIAINGTPLPALGATVTFTTSGISKKIKNPRVEVKAYQAQCAPGYTCVVDDQAVIGTVETYGEGGSLAQATGDGSDPLGYVGFLLGGGSSAWLAQGGVAHCVANLFYFDNSGKTQTYVRLATCEFDALG